VCQNTAISKLVYDFVSGFYRGREDGTSTPVSGGSRSSHFDEVTGNPLARLHTLLIDSRSSESGEALDDRFPRDGGRRDRPLSGADIVERTGEARTSDSITDQELLREVMNTVGRRISSAPGFDAWCRSRSSPRAGTPTTSRTSSHRAFGTQLLCEQVIGARFVVSRMS